MALYVVATPIGNADDISVRALKVLADVDVIAAEDTRKTGRLLEKHGIRNRLVSHHEHNERASADGLLALLAEGKDVALVTNAGTPLLSDPGYVLVSRAIRQDCDVISIPGPSAITAAISVSGLPVHEMHFMGFAPRKPGALVNSLQRAAGLEGTVIYFESPKRIGRFLSAAMEVLGDCRCAIAREMTKIHEEVVRGTVSELSARFASFPPKGELVILLSPGK